jgi:hypothetical protein
MENTYFLIIIILITIVLILLKRVNHKGNIIDKFSSGNLASSNQEIAIRDTIDELVNRRFSNLYLDEVDPSESSLLDDLDDTRTFDLGHDSPIGMISYFYNDPNPPNQVCWIECNGETIQRREYPQFFNTLGSTYSQDNFTLPNVVGRIIVGAGTIQNPNDDSVKNSNSRYGPSNKVAFNSGGNNIEFGNMETGGFDVCPADNVSTASLARSGESSVPICTNMSNMPPHIYMTAWMKVKNKRFKISF